MDINQKITDELGVKRWQVDAAVKLIDEGNTIPFIAILNYLEGLLEVPFMCIVKTFTRMDLLTERIRQTSNTPEDIRDGLDGKMEYTKHQHMAPLGHLL